MSYAPIVRIIIRYVVGLYIGAEAAEAAAQDPDLVDVISTGIAFVVGVVTEMVYAQAVKRGWSK